MTGKAEAADRPKNSCKTKEEHPGVTDSLVDGAEGRVITDTDTALATSDTQVKMSLCEAQTLQISRRMVCPTFCYFLFRWTH